MYGFWSLLAHLIVTTFAALAIVAEHSFFIKQDKHQMKFKTSVDQALDTYLQSPQYIAAIRAVDNINFDDSGTEGRSPSQPWYRPRSKTVTERQAVGVLSRNLLQAIVEIVMDNRLSN